MSKKNKAIQPQLYPLKILLADGTSIDTVTCKNARNKENIFRLDILLQDHPAWTGEIFNSKRPSSVQSAKRKNTGLDIFSLSV